MCVCVCVCVCASTRMCDCICVRVSECACSCLPVSLPIFKWNDDVLSSLVSPMHVTQKLSASSTLPVIHIRFTSWRRVVAA
jgi:hypothetical protein